MHRNETAVVERNILFHQTAQTVEQGGAGHGLGCVQVPPEFRSSAAEVKGRRAILRIDGQTEADQAVSFFFSSTFFSSSSL
ncbi:MAG: hypothetical protein SD837_10330 [Candidatus Electrothrix scaldis]|nr:MAG: hypothetical protein SD837_10330 [Candidatus Electrothrix sp. GW3-3]